MLTYDLPEVRKYLFQTLRLRMGVSVSHWYGTVEGENKHFNHMISALARFQEGNMGQFVDLQDTVVFEMAKCRHLPRLIPIAYAFFNTDDEPPEQWARSVNLLRGQIFKLVNHHEATAKEFFFQKHRERFEKDKKGLLGFFCTTEVNRQMSLREVLQHGQAKNNRTRQICIELDWMTPEGELTSFAPGLGT